MKKKFVALFFFVAALVLVFSQIGFAQDAKDMKGRLGLGARVAYVNYSGDSFDELGYSIKVDFDDNVMYGGNLTYFVHEYFSFELSVDYAKTDVDARVLGVSANIGEMKQVPILLTARTHLSTNPKVSPYIGIGIGYYLNDWEMSDALKSEIPPGYSVDTEDSIGFHVNLGVESFVNKHVALNLEAKYIWNRTDVELKSPYGTWIDESVDLDTFYLGVGVKYYF
jgi:outer membrane protein